MPKPLEDSPCKQVRQLHSLSLLCLLWERFKLFNEGITHTSTPLKKINWYFPVGGFSICIWLPLPYCCGCCDQQSKVAQRLSKFHSLSVLKLIIFFLSNTHLVPRTVNLFEEAVLNFSCRNRKKSWLKSGYFGQYC